jgi:hypothetical protein
MLSCMCQNYTDTNGIIDTFNVELYTNVKDTSQKIGGYVCYDWVRGYMLITIFDLLITAVIILTDFVLRIIIICLVEWVNFRSLPNRLRIIQTLLFISQYLNNGLSLMLISFTLDEIIVHVPFMDGDYPDFTKRWFQEISPFFITPMIANIFISLIEFTGNYLYCKLIIWHDRGFGCNKKWTKSKTISQYVRIHSNPENEIFDRYAFVLMMIFINMAFGVGLPILFPLTLMALVSLYVFERLFQVYWYQKSVMIIDFLNKNAIRSLKWAVHLYTTFGYWYITNKQIFYNDVTATMRKSDREITNHTIFNIPIDQTFPLFVFALVLLV